MFLLRHGQSYFNLHMSRTRVDPGIEDPELTPLGESQAVEAAKRLAAARLTRIIVSPYLRALQTAEAVRTVHPVPLDVMHEVRERAAFTCDIGSPPHRLAARFPQHSFAHLPMRWWPAQMESTDETVARANAFRDYIAASPESPTTLVVSHWAFIMALTGTSLANGEILEYDPASAAPEDLVWRP